MFVILLYGRSGSGKTTISRELQTFLKERYISCSVMSLDSFYKESYEGSFDTPDAFHWERLSFSLKQLQKQSTIYLQSYDYATKQYLPHTSEAVYPSDVLIIEGILANYCTDVFDPFVIHVDTPADICLARRVLRDETEREIPIKDNIESWLGDVRVQWKRW